MKRKVLLFAAVLLLMLAIRYAAGQNTPSEAGWTLDESSFGTSMEDDLILFSVMAPIIGAVFGMIRVFAQRSAAPVLEPLRLN